MCLRQQVRGFIEWSNTSWTSEELLQCSDNTLPSNPTIQMRFDIISNNMTLIMAGNQLLHPVHGIHHTSKLHEMVDHTLQSTETWRKAVMYWESRDWEISKIGASIIWLSNLRVDIRRLLQYSIHHHRVSLPKKYWPRWPLHYPD